MRRLLGAAPPEQSRASAFTIRPVTEGSGRAGCSTKASSDNCERNGILLGKRMCARQRRDMGLIEDQALREPGFGW